MNEPNGENMNAIYTSRVNNAVSSKLNFDLRLLEASPRRPSVFAAAWRMFKSHARSTAKFLSGPDMGLEEWRRIEFKNEYQNREKRRIQPERWL